jgi:hypothetical protein
MNQGPDASGQKKPWWLFTGSRRAARALAALWLVVAAFAAAQLVLTDTVGVRWAATAQLSAALVLAGSYFRSARYDGPREVRPSTSRWGAGRPGERWR